MKKQQGLYLVLFVVLMVLLFMPLIQQLFQPFQLRRLDGDKVETEKPTLSYEGYKEQTYQV